MARRQSSSDREAGFDLSFCSTAKLPNYNSLYDPNMRHFFENKTTQRHLLKTGQIDRNGRVIDLEKNKSKLHIIEQEFKSAERIEYWRQKEEEDMRYRVQQKRHAALERARSQEKLAKLKEDRGIRREIVAATRESFGLNYPQSRPKASSGGPAMSGRASLESGGSYFE